MPFSTSSVLGVNLNATVAGTTTNGVGAPYALGALVEGGSGQRWMLVQASGAITQYDTVLIDEDGQAAAMTTTLATEASGSAGNFVGFAQVAFADNDFGWVALVGSDIRARLYLDTVGDTKLYSSGTAGVLSSLSAGVLINGVVSIATITASTNQEIIASGPISRLDAGLAA